MSKEKDLVVLIMRDWYKAMEKHGISVQPKASTILGTVLAKHLNNGEKDVFDVYMNTKAGELEAYLEVNDLTLSSLTKSSNIIGLTFPFPLSADKTVFR